MNRVNFQGGVFVDDWNLRTANLVPLPSVANQVQNAGGRPNSRVSALLWSYTINTVYNLYIKFADITEN